MTNTSNMLHQDKHVLRIFYVFNSNTFIGCIVKSKFFFYGNP